MAIPQALAVTALLGLAGCDWMAPPPPAPAANMSVRAKLERDRVLQRACGSAATYDRLKAIAFDEVARLRGAGTVNLDVLAARSVIRMVAPVAKSRDESLNITVCTGHMVIELPPGTAPVFGAQRLEADVEYAAQEAADGSGLVYRLQGADAMIARIAGSPLERLATLGGTRTANMGAAPTVPQLLPPAEAERDEQPGAVPPSESRASEDRAQAPTVRPAAARPPTARPARDLDPIPARRAPQVAQPVQTAVRPSFNCRYARSRSERAICSDADLARRDRAMSAAFYAALAGGDGRTKTALRASRDRFLRFRDRCPDSDCIAQSYADRIDEIRDIADDR